MKWCWNSAWCTRWGPPITMFLLVGVAYWLYSLHTTISHDPQDQFLALFLAVSLFSLAVYFLLRTREWRPQMLGLIGFMLGQSVFYWIIAGKRLGWFAVSGERTLDVVRAFVTVCLLILIGGVLLFELAEWRKRRRLRRAPQIVSPEYVGAERRSGPFERRKRRRKW